MTSDDASTRSQVSRGTSNLARAVSFFRDFDGHMIEGATSDASPDEPA